MKRKIEITCVVLNIVLILFFILLIILPEELKNTIIDFLRRDLLIIRIIFLLLGISSLYLWILNLRYWSCSDKQVYNLYLLLLFSFLYSPLYYLTNKSHKHQNTTT